MIARALQATAVRPFARVDQGSVGAWLLGFALVTYLALEGGGYDIVVRSQIGIALWWIVLVGAFLGVVAQRRPTRSVIACVGLLAAFVAWSAASALWSESPERAIGETARLVTLLALLVLAATTLTRRQLRPLVNGVFVAIAGVAVLAALSRLHPAWFAEPETAKFLPGTRSRLSFPVNYWNALAALIAVGLPLGLAVATTARSAPARSLAVGVLPLMGLAAFLTLSRGGLLAIAAGLLAAGLLTADRGRWLAKLALAAIGTTILVKGALQRDALRDGLMTPLAQRQGDELVVLAVVVVAGTALLHAGAGLARGGARLRPTVPRLHPAWTRALAAALIAIAASGAVVAGSQGRLETRWAEFKNPSAGLGDGRNTGLQRFGSASGNGRYQYWLSAVDAAKTAPMTGIGAGSWESWWARRATLSGTVRNAHSLYAETLGELGFVGIALLGGFILVVIFAGVRTSWLAAGEPRALLAGATAACVAFAVASGVDWSWQVTVLPACFVLLAAALLAPDGAPALRGRSLRVGLVALSAVGVVALAVPLAGAVGLRESQRSASAGQFGTALQEAATALHAQPYALSPLLQRALVLELRGDLRAAVVAARAAERQEPTNWRAPFVLARLEAERGRVTPALAAYDRARFLNQTSSVLR